MDVLARTSNAIDGKGKIISDCESVCSMAEWRSNAIQRFGEPVITYPWWDLS